MARIVRKYGGSSLKDTDAIRLIASRVADLRWNGDEVVLVVSAMASTTDEFTEMGHALHPDPPRREMDMLLSVGERISCSLLALALEAEGVSAVSFTGSQVGIITDTHHGEARIVDIRPARLLDALENGIVPVVAGFQGVSIQKEITTLGRGGSDATAVALAAAIDADRCELMKGVDGLHTAHPDKVEDAQIIENIDFESALRLARGGMEALQSEAVRIARDKKVPLAVGSTDKNILGTIITNRPFDCGEIIGLGRQDGLLRHQGTGPISEESGVVRFTEDRGRWIRWREGTKGEDAPLSGITVVSAGRRVPGLHETITSSLDAAAIPRFGQLEQPGEYWVCVETKHADEALQILHRACRDNGWIPESEIGENKSNA